MTTYRQGQFAGWSESEQSETLSARDHKSPNTVVVGPLQNAGKSPRGVPSTDEVAGGQLVVVPSSQASADSTTDSPELGFDTPSSVSRTLGGEKSLLTTSPEFPSTRTFALSENQRGELLMTDVAHQLTSGGGKPVQGYSAVAFLAKTSPSPDDAQDSQELAPDSSTSSPESLSLFDLDGYSSRTYPDCSPRTAVGTSESCLERWPTSGTAWAGGFSTAVSSECRSDEDGCSSSEPSLTEILEEPQSVPAKYSLSARAAQGILRRAQKRGRTLPSHLSAALKAVALTTTTDREVV